MAVKSLNEQNEVHQLTICCSLRAYSSSLSAEFVFVRSKQGSGHPDMPSLISFMETIKTNKSKTDSQIYRL